MTVARGQATPDALAMPHRTLHLSATAMRQCLVEGRKALQRLRDEGALPEPVAAYLEACPDAIQAFAGRARVPQKASPRTESVPPEQVAQETIRALTTGRYRPHGSTKSVTLPMKRLAASYQACQTLRGPYPDPPAAGVRGGGCDRVPVMTVFEGGSFDAVVALGVRHVDPLVCVLDFASDSNPGARPST